MMKSLRTIFEYIRFRVGTRPLHSFFFYALKEQELKAARGYSPHGNYYEFGVGAGDILVQYIDALKSFCKVRHKDISKYRIFAFDSFEGLPEGQDDRDYHPSWSKGDFSHSVGEISKLIKKKWGRVGIQNTMLVKGYYKETLTPQLLKKLKDWPPAIVEIDVDYYSSTIKVLEWLRPILKSGTYFYFDDTWAFAGNPKAGELAAIAEFNKKGEGLLTPYPAVDITLGGRIYIYSNRKYEYIDGEKLSKS